MLTDPISVCIQQASEHGSDFRVAGAFATTVGQARELFSNDLAGVAAAADRASAVVCYLDGPFPIGPPPVDGAAHPGFDRGVFVVSGGSGTQLTLGYRQDITILDPNE